MLKSIVKALGFIAGLALSGAVCAMGMGGINVTTALGEPLKAEIELVAVSNTERNSLSAHLASPDVFKGAGMDYPSGLSSLKFQIETRANGEPYLKVTTIQPVNEPFISLLVELNWSSGKLLREYTLLLDPPGYKAEQPKAAEVKPVAPSGAAAPSVANPPSVTVPPMRATAPMDKKIFAEVPTSVPDRKPALGSNVSSGDIKVKRGDTLIGIARQTKPSEVSLERMLVALYRSNADAFDGKNMNRLKTGKILHMPESQDIGKLAQSDAVKEIHVQVADWHAYRQKLAAASGAVTERAPKQETSGKISTTVADKAPAAKESAKEVVRLSKGEAPGDKAGAAGNAKGLQEKVRTLEEEAIARSKMLKESNERIALLEKNIKEMQHLIELKGQLAAAEKPVPGKVGAQVEVKPASKPEPAKVEAKPPVPVAAPVAAPQLLAAPAIAVASAVVSASAVKPVKPAVKPVAAPEPPPSSLLDEPLYLVGGAAALLALGGLGFMLARRSKGGKAKKKIAFSGKELEKDIDIDVATARISAPVTPSPDTGDFTQTAAVAPISQAQPEDIDPINEADLFLSFGRDVQAEEILKDALEKNPASNPIKLKLLSIYANRKDANSFSAIARQVQDSGDAAAWAQAAEIGRNLEPSNPMYGGTADEQVISAPMDQGMAERQQAAGLDFDLGFGEPTTISEAESAVESGESLDGKATATHAVDFDLGFGEPEAAIAAEDESTPVAGEAVATSDLDFDLGLGEEPSPPAAIPVEDFASTMVLKAPLGDKTMVMSPDDVHAAQETPMDFDITAELQTLEKPETEQAAASTSDLDDLVFDITATHPSPAAIVEEKPAEDVSAGTDDALGFTLDFPVTEEVEPAPAQAATKEAAGLDLSGISLDMAELASPASSAPAVEVRDARWHDVATKLDLAKAYQEMGDNAGAREILEEVLAEGDEQQCTIAKEMLQLLG